MGKFSNWRFQKIWSTHSHRRKMLRLWPIMDRAPQIPTVYYTMNTKKMKSSSLEDLSKDIFERCGAGRMQGVEILPTPVGTPFAVATTCRLILTPNKKYPMIVNYYGGCSPIKPQFCQPLPASCVRRIGLCGVCGRTEWSDRFRSGIFCPPREYSSGMGWHDDIIEGTQQVCVKLMPLSTARKSAASVLPMAAS